MNLNWITPEVSLPETIHFTDDYVVHGRGFTVGDDIWYDEYAVHGGHMKFWHNIITDYYDGEGEYDVWTAREGYPDDGYLYWSITGSQTFILQYPLVGDLTEVAWDRLKETLKELDAPDDLRVSMRMRMDTDSHAQSLLKGGSSKKQFSRSVKEIMESEFKEVSR